MLQRLIDDFKEFTGTALRLTSLAAAAAMALLVTTAFLCAAVFVFVLEKYGPVQACLTGAAIFFVVTLIAAGRYMVRKRSRADRGARRTGGEGGEVHRADRAVRSDAGCGRHPGDPRHRRQEADPDPCGRGTGAGIFRQPRQRERQCQRSAGGVAGCRAFHSCAFVGWVERSDTHQCRCVWRWVSLRSTHPTKNDFAISRLRPRFASSFAA